MRVDSLDACKLQQAACKAVVESLLQGRRQGDGEGDGPAGAPQGHHVAQVLVLEWQQRAPVDGGPQVPGHVVRLLEGHLWHPCAASGHDMKEEQRYTEQKYTKGAHMLCTHCKVN